MKHDSLIEESIGILPSTLQIEGKYFICHDCKTKIQKGRIPAMSNMNKLQIVDTEGKEELHLTELKNFFFARDIIFQKYLQLPKSSWTATKDRIVNIPIFEEDILETIKNLPRTLDEAGIIKVHLKRQMKIKNSHLERSISVTTNFIRRRK